MKFKIKATIFIPIFLLFLSGAVNIRAAGEIDPTFNANVGNFLQESTNAVAIQPDGKILVAGNFNGAGGQPRNNIARFNADGTFDASFNAGAFTAFSSSGNSIPVVINVITVQPDGKILIAGNFTTIAGTTRPNIARLNADGSLDNTFVTGSSTTTFIMGTVNAIALQTDGKIMVGGSFSIQNNVGGVNTTRTNLIRYNTDGSYDATFDFNPPGAVNDIIIQPDGKIVIGGNLGTIARLNIDGSLDQTFANLSIQSGTQSGQVAAIARQSDGKYVVVGSFTTVGGVQQGNIARLNADGTLDANFNVGGTGFNSSPADVAIAPDGKIIAVGSFGLFNGVSRIRAARLNANGTLDTTFVPSGLPPIFTGTDVVVQPDGRPIIVGTNNSTTLPGSFFRLNLDGSLDTSFAGMVSYTRQGFVYDIQLQPDGKILIGGDFSIVNGVPRSKLARLNADGSLDTSFVPNVNIGTGVGGIYAVALQADGKSFGRRYSRRRCAAIKF